MKCVSFIIQWGPYSLCSSPQLEGWEVSTEASTKDFLWVPELRDGEISALLCGKHSQEPSGHSSAFHSRHRGGDTVLESLAEFSTACRSWSWCCLGWVVARERATSPCMHTYPGTLGYLDPKILCVCADAPFGCRLRRGAALSSSSGRVAMNTEAEQVPTP